MRGDDDERTVIHAGLCWWIVEWGDQESGDLQREKLW